MKLVEHVLENKIRDMVDVDEMQFGFVPKKDTTDAIFIIRKLQEKYISVKKLFYLHSLTWKRHLIGYPERLFGGIENVRG